MQHMRRRPSLTSCRLDLSIPATSTPCTSPFCPVKVPHNTGVYLHNGLPNLPLPAHSRFGFSNPPPQVWAAHRKIVGGVEGTSEERALVDAFVQNHVCSEEAEKSIQERVSQQRSAQDSASRLTYAPVEANDDFTFESGSSMFQDLTISSRPKRALGTRPSSKIIRSQARQTQKNGALDACRSSMQTLPILQNLPVRTRSIRALGTRPSVKLAATKEQQQEQSDDAEVGHMSPNTLKALEQEFEEAIEELELEEEEAGIKY